MPCVGNTCRKEKQVGIKKPTLKHGSDQFKIHKCDDGNTLIFIFALGDETKLTVTNIHFKHEFCHESSLKINQVTSDSEA